MSRSARNNYKGITLAVYAIAGLFLYFFMASLSSGILFGKKTALAAGLIFFLLGFLLLLPAWFERLKMQTLFLLLSYMGLGVSVFMSFNNGFDGAMDMWQRGESNPYYSADVSTHINPLFIYLGNSILYASCQYILDSPPTKRKLVLGLIPLIGYLLVILIVMARGVPTFLG